MGLTPLVLLVYPVASYAAQCCAAPHDEHAPAAPPGAALHVSHVPPGVGRLRR